ncbi:MAG: efflux RND transporter periplasmic adaptor subunit [Proteobacteria bacterium]|nr:efflux RND transporter periplasmic adaptor subunit [Pseudomonadota bacterium]
MTRARRTLTLAALAVLVIAIGAWLIHPRPGSRAATPRSDPAVPVNVATVTRHDVPVRLHAIGNIEPYTTVSVKALVDGQIVAVRFAEGQEVRQNAVLFEIDRRPFEAQLAQAQANLVKDRAVLDHAAEQRKRYEDLLAQKFISPDAYGQVKATAESAAAQVRADEAAIEGVKLQLNYCTIRAPITGYAGKIMIQRGNLVKANDTNALVVVNQVRPIYASFSIPEQNLDAVRKYLADGELSVTAVVPGSGATPVTGKLTFIDNTTDVSTGTIKLKAEFANADKALWPGQFVNVVLTLTQEKNALVMPSTAVQNGPDGQYVFVIGPDGHAALRNVRIERTEGGDAVIASGLEPGERVVTAGQLRLAPGMAVTVDNAKGA